MSSGTPSEGRRLSPRWEYGLVLLAGAAGAGLVFLGVRQGWAHVHTSAPRPLPGSNVTVTGQDLAPAASALAIAGLATVGLAVSAAILLVTDYVSSGLTAALITAFVTLLFAGLWFALPLARRR